MHIHFEKMMDIQQEKEVKIKEWNEQDISFKKNLNKVNSKQSYCYINKIEDQNKNQDRNNK